MRVCVFVCVCENTRLRITWVRLHVSYLLSFPPPLLSPPLPPLLSLPTKAPNIMAALLAFKLGILMGGVGVLPPLSLCHTLECFNPFRGKLILGTVVADVILIRVAGVIVLNKVIWEGADI